jgi:hypothetical protein
VGGTLIKTDLGHGRGWLEAEAAKSQARIDRALGYPQQITEAGRSWEQQNAHWLTFQKYGKPIALHPDTPSVHQKGRAKDTDERNVALMNEHGWFQTVYRTVNGRRTLVEPWHFEYFPERDKHRNDPDPAGESTRTPLEEDDMLALKINAGTRGEHLCTLAPGVFSHMIGADNPEWIKNVIRADDAWADVPLNRLPALLHRFGCDLHIWDIRNGEFVVLNPLTGQATEGGMWSAVNAGRAGIEQVRITSEETAAYIAGLPS